MNQFEIKDASSQGETIWNRFVRDHYPPVGSFMLTWEWGVFQRSLGRKVEYFFVKEKKEIVAAFTFVRHKLPLGFHYGYLPRGPVIARGAVSDTLAIFETIKEWAIEKHPDLIFVRLEPPTEKIPFELQSEGFQLADFYVQPRHNHTVPLEGDEEEIKKRFHPSTRSNLTRAERRGVTVKLDSPRGPEDCEEFFKMAEQTMVRNDAKNVYPSRAYFDSLIKSTLPLGEVSDKDRLSIGMFSGFHEGKPAAINFVLFFGDTATYLYGAAYTEHLSSKVTTYLHWSAMQEAQKRGFKYYDIGGVDEKKWPSLTTFKRQFGGIEFSYIGNIDIPIRPKFHTMYNIVRKIKKTE